jgi:hypothetical protein
MENSMEVMKSEIINSRNKSRVHRRNEKRANGDFSPDSDIESDLDC